MTRDSLLFKRPKKASVTRDVSSLHTATVAVFRVHPNSQLGRNDYEQPLDSPIESERTVLDQIVDEAIGEEETAMLMKHIPGLTRPG